MGAETTDGGGFSPRPVKPTGMSVHIPSLVL